MTSNQASQPPAAVKCVAVMVLYHPDKERLAEALTAASAQVSLVVIYDNTPAAKVEHSLTLLDFQRFTCQDCCVALLGDGSNVGLAAGLNRGIQYAMGSGATHVLLLDQDSVCAPTMVSHLFLGLGAAEAHGCRVAAAGPNFVDARGDVPPPFLKVGFPTCRPVRPAPGQTYVDTDVLITSGSLVSTRALVEVGLMAEPLYIDNVDIEWGFRAKAAGWRLIGVPSATLNHQLGEQRRPVPWWLRWTGRKHLLHHPPIRLYYIMRNRVALQKLHHVPLAWKLQDLLRMPWRFILGIQSAESKKQAFLAMSLGVWHGLIGVAGSAPKTSAWS